MTAVLDIEHLMAVDRANQQPAVLPGVTFAVVHGDKVDGHFFETAMNYMTYQQHREVERLTTAMRAAASHVTDPKARTSLLAEADQPVFQEAFVGVRSGPLLSMGRGQIFQSFLEGTQNRWCLLSDSDMTWNIDVPRAMVKLAEDQDLKNLSAVAWIVRTRPDGTIESRTPNVYKAVRHAEGEFLHPITEEELAFDGLAQVGAVGAAFMLIRRDLVEKVRDEVCGGNPFWFHHLPAMNGDQYGEDTSFCLRIRQAGEPIWIHPGIELGHAKTVIQKRDIPTTEGTQTNG